jgi:hypothetical protein
MNHAWLAPRNINMGDIMPNMSYCRFENTAKDLEDCLECFDDELSKTEDKARNNIIEMALRIVGNYRYDTEASDD